MCKGSGVANCVENVNMDAKVAQANCLDCSLRGAEEEGSLISATIHDHGP